MSYGGRLDTANPPAGMNAFAVPVFKTGDPRYSWLNGVQAAGNGRLVLNADGGQPGYDFLKSADRKAF